MDINLRPDPAFLKSRELSSKRYDNSPNTEDKKSGAREKAADAIRTVYGLFRPLLGPRACRFHPTCSEYSFQSFKLYGLFKGALLSAARIGRCHPWNPGGYDPVPLSRHPSDPQLNRETN